MTDKRLNDLYNSYGKILYGTAYIRLSSRGDEPSYENLKKEIITILAELTSKTNKQYVKTR